MNRLLQSLGWVAGLLAVTPLAASAKEGSTVSAVPVCELAHWDASMVGRVIAVRANYSTDFMHGSYLVSPDCPDFSLPLDVDDPGSSSAERDSVSAFSEKVSRGRDYYGEDFWVVVRGKFIWLSAKTINADLEPRKQLVIPARGAIMLREVLDYHKPSVPKR